MATVETTDERKGQIRNIVETHPLLFVLGAAVILLIVMLILVIAIASIL